MPDEMGIEYFFSASDGIHTTRLPAGPDSTYSHATIKYTDTNSPFVSVPGGGSAVSWKIIAIPYVLPSAQISQIFTNLGGVEKELMAHPSLYYQW